MDARTAAEVLERMLVTVLQSCKAANVSVQVGNMEMAERDLGRAIVELELAIGQAKLMADGKHLCLPSEATI